ncbi:hypothetical protein [Spongiactinospora sp. 9N601]|uniref:hypothetical protein n=1 Tax=Spongiactinospora sp. 9N601 TaxID=3375149 RepID=UPI0037B440FD
MDAVEHLFQLLCEQPHCLMIDGTLAPDLPQRPIPLNELRSMLRHPLLSGATRDAVWRELVSRARTGGPLWQAAITGIALPTLRAIAGRIADEITAGRRVPDVAVIDHEVLTRFLDAVRTTDLDQPNLRFRLCAQARQAQERFRTGARAIAPLDATSMNSARSRITSDIASDSDLEKGGRGVTSGSARPLFPPPRPAPARAAAPSRRPQDAPPLTGRAATPPAETATPGRRWQRRLRNAVVVVAIVAVVVATLATVAFGMIANPPPSPPTRPEDLGRVFDNTRTWLVGLLAALATLMLTVGGVRYLIAGGDPGEVHKAKAALKASAFGYTLAVLAPLLVNVLRHLVSG